MFFPEWLHVQKITMSKNNYKDEFSMQQWHINSDACVWAMSASTRIWNELVLASCSAPTLLFANAMTGKGIICEVNILRPSPYCKALQIFSLYIYNHDMSMDTAKFFLLSVYMCGNSRRSSEQDLAPSPPGRRANETLFVILRLLLDNRISSNQLVETFNFHNLCW